MQLAFSVDPLIKLTAKSTYWSQTEWTQSDSLLLSSEPHRYGRIIIQDRYQPGEDAVSDNNL